MKRSATSASTSSQSTLTKWLKKSEDKPSRPNPKASMALKQFPCKTKNCGKKFNSRVKLQAHLKVHQQKTSPTAEAKKTKENKDYVCSSCGREFKMAGPHKRHENACKNSKEKASDPPISPLKKKSLANGIKKALQETTKKLKESSKDSILPLAMKGMISTKIQSLLEDTNKNATNKSQEDSLHNDASVEIASSSVEISTSMKNTGSPTKSSSAKKDASGSSKDELRSSATESTKSPLREKATKGSKNSQSEKTISNETKSKSSKNKEGKGSPEKSTKVSNETVSAAEKLSDMEDESVQLSLANDVGNLEKSLLSIMKPSISSSSKAFVCAICSRTFGRKYHLERHLTLSPCSGLPPPSHPCKVCGKSYTRKDNLREHLRAHTGDIHRHKKYKCDYCDRQFHGMSLLKIHERKHTGEKPFKCDFCSNCFASTGALVKHRRTHTGEKPFECNDCGLRFSLKGTLNRHTRVHTGVRPHKCEFCGKRFIQTGGLKAHLFYHTGENGFKCEHCGKVFNRKARLHMHIKYVHDKLKPYKCEQCSKSFSRKEDLNRHFIIHTGEKPFQCPTCNKRFSIKPSLKLHLLTHTKEEPRSCHECGRAFIRKDCLLRHMRKRHRDLLDKILLDEKDKKFTNESSATSSRVMNEKGLSESIRELLSLLVDEPTLIGFGWPDRAIDELLEAVIRRCGHTPVNPADYSYLDCLRENSKLLFTVVIDDNAVKTLLNNQTVDEVILHVLRLAKMN